VEVDHAEFNRPGDVIVYNRDGSNRYTPVIHRAMLWVEDGENWYDRADPDAVGSADNCAALRNCPAPHAGFITKGDNDRTNARYDQVSGLSAPVKPGWVIGRAEIRIPYLGEIRLLLQKSPAAPALDRSNTGPRSLQAPPVPAVASAASGLDTRPATAAAGHGHAGLVA